MNIVYVGSTRCIKYSNQKSLILRHVLINFFNINEVNRIHIRCEFHDSDRFQRDAGERQ